LLVAIFTGPEDLAVEVLNQVSYAPTIQYFQKKKDEPKPGATRTFLGLITKAILGTGTFIIFIILAVSSPDFYVTRFSRNSRNS